ncbi:MAG TPA: hypothetical protein VFD70_19640 [Anaerolineae bacterium]|nr:hypothetical protein [Anaerolineae bacterium]
MKDKSFFKRLRVLMAAGSIAGFVGGWALLAQTDPSNSNDSVAMAQVINPTPTAELSPTLTATAQATVVATATATATLTATVTPLTQISTTTQTTTFTTSSQTRLRTGGS